MSLEKVFKGVIGEVERFGKGKKNKKPEEEEKSKEMKRWRE